MKPIQPHLTRLETLAILASTLCSAACGTQSPDPGASDPAVEIAIAALNLEGVGDVIWDIEVVNGDDPAAVVWRQRVTSTQYGDGAGSATYVGPCDASDGVASNTVRVWVVGLYADAVSSTDAGAFNGGETQGVGAVDGTPLPFVNPTAAGPLERTFTCSPNADVYVPFDVTMMRPAQQGFFDVAVNFDDIFCSAKFDCCRSDAQGACVGDNLLLHSAAGERGRTFVLGFACTAGTGENVITELYLDDLELDCGVGGEPGVFFADLTIDPSPIEPGNLCSLSTGMSDCPYITEAAGVDADDYLFQAAVYRGEESLGIQGLPANKVYWNVALGVRPDIAQCRFRVEGTAADALDGDSLALNGVISAGAVYPVLRWGIDLGACGAEPLTFGDPDAPVSVTYTPIGGQSRSFANRFSPAMPHPFVAGFTENSATHIWGTGSGDNGNYYELNGISYYERILASNEPPATFWYPPNPDHSNGGVGWPAPQEIVSGLVIPAGTPWKITINARGAAATESFTFDVFHDESNALLATFDVITQANLSTYYTYSVGSVPFDIRLRVVKTTPTGFDFYIWSGTLPPGIGLYPQADVLF